jgi:uncharacterized protein RhaS with RHS repeats
MGARVYDPYTGTFTQPDPIPGGGANAYGYTDGDPVNETDLSGTSVVGDECIRDGNCNPQTGDPKSGPSLSDWLDVLSLVPVPGLEEADIAADVGVHAATFNSRALVATAAGVAAKQVAAKTVTRAVVRASSWTLTHPKTVAVAKMAYKVISHIIGFP